METRIGLLLDAWQTLWSVPRGGEPGTSRKHLLEVSHHYSCLWETLTATSVVSI